MFGVATSADFYEKLVTEYQSLHANPTSAVHALNGAMTAYHLAEWIWGDWLKSDVQTRASLEISSIDDFKKWLDRKTPLFSALQDVTNGAKHFDTSAFDKTKVSKGAFSRAAFSPSAFQVEGFRVQVESNGTTN